jgi:hypothetical protein
MRILSANKVFCSFLLLCAAACILQPVMADNGTITITYRGSGGSYVGDTVVFDGRNTYGNITLIKINGPGLPSGGVPVNNLNGAAGTATSVEVDPYGMWKFVWYASTVPGVEKLMTARYTFTATDSLNPDKSATAFFMLRKPEYSISASPNPSKPGDYIELSGIAEQGITSAKIEVKDASGTVLHTFTSPVGSSGSMSYGFHSDMGPGQYTVTVSNPALKVPFGTVISVVPGEGTLPVTTIMTPEQGSGLPTAVVTADATPAPVSETSTAKSPVAPLTIIAAIMAGISMAVIIRR